ncbi:zona pellucida sperm-binding protein 4-like [Rhincodon typus]|uniref:zona pellucida sperm-binding protein 4-like n=1 Tax=Rhincodon typus TaxID=259920 RepID=UPI002030C53E|nr:zona pellucida sperm-binding protein 4-like [Rhincodon typus]
MGLWLVCWLCLWAALPFLFSAVCDPEPAWRLPCGPPAISSTDCIKQGCCFESPSLSGQPCFYNLRESPGKQPPPGSHSEREETGSFVYETDILGKRMIQTGPQVSITRDSTFSLHVQCKYKGEHEAGLQINVSVYTLPPPLAASEDGILMLKLRIAKDGNYRSWYKDSDYPIERILQESVFVEVCVKDRTDPVIVLRLRDCWAAPDHEVQWSLLVDGCPCEGEDYLTVLHPVDASSGLQFPTHHKRFEVKTFVFLDGVSEQPLSEQVTKLME